MNNRIPSKAETFTDFFERFRAFGSEPTLGFGDVAQILLGQLIRRLPPRSLSL